MSGALRVPRVAAEALPYQAALDRLIAEPPPRLLRAWPLLGAGLLVALVGLSSVLPLDIVVTAQGELAADAPPMVLKPMARAVLSALLVRPGDRVKKGQVLARLDPTLPAADRAALQAERDATLAQIARLEAELAGTPLPAGSAEAVLQGQVLESRAELAAARRNRLAADIAALAAAVDAAAAQVALVEDRLAIARTLEESRQELVARGLAPETEALAARSARLATEADLADRRARLAELRRGLTDAEGTAREFELALRQEAAEALPPLRLRLAQLDDALAKATRLDDLSTIIAPRDGTVVSIAPGGEGAVVAEGDPLIALIPGDAVLIADIAIPSDEVGRVAPGDAVALKIDAFPWRRMGQAQGVLTSISPASLAPTAGTVASHPSRVALTGQPEDMPAGAALLPGMTLTAEIHTGSRTVLEFFLDPLLRGLNESLREP